MYELYPKEHEVWWVVMLWDGGEKNLDEELRSRKICCTFVLQESCIMWNRSDTGCFFPWPSQLSSCESSALSLGGGGGTHNKPFSRWDSYVPACPFTSSLKASESCYTTCFSNPVCDSLHCNYFCYNKLCCCLSMYKYWKDASHVEVIKIQFTCKSNRKSWDHLWVKMKGGNVFC